jgi:hypothetical protein
MSGFLINPKVHGGGGGGGPTGDPWDLTTAAYNSVTTTVLDLVGVANGNPTDFLWNNDGTKAFLLLDSNQTLYEINALNPYELAGCTVGINHTFTEDTSTQSIFFKDNGLTLYMLGIGSDNVYQFLLGAPYDISLVIPNGSFNITAFAPVATEMFINSLGNRMFITDINTDIVVQYNLLSAWDVTSASFATAFGVGTEDGSPRGMFFKPDGTRMFIAGSDTSTCYQYDLISGFELSSPPIYNGVSLDIVLQSNTPNSFRWNDVGTRFHIVDQATDDIIEYVIT